MLITQESPSNLKPDSDCVKSDYWGESLNAERLFVEGLVRWRFRKCDNLICSDQSHSSESWSESHQIHAGESTLSQKNVPVCDPSHSSYISSVSS